VEMKSRLKGKGMPETHVPPTSSSITDIHFPIVRDFLFNDLNKEMIISKPLLLIVPLLVVTIDLAKALQA